MENAKIKKFKCDILSNFQTMLELYNEKTNDIILMFLSKINVFREDFQPDFCDHKRLCSYLYCYWSHHLYEMQISGFSAAYPRLPSSARASSRFAPVAAFILVLLKLQLFYIPKWWWHHKNWGAILTQMHPQMGSKRSNAIIPFVWIRTRAIRTRLQDSFHTIWEHFSTSIISKVSLSSRKKVPIFQD